MASSKRAKRKRRQATRSARPAAAAPASPGRAQQAAERVAADRRVSGLGERMRAYRAGIVAPLLALPVLIASTITTTAPDGVVRTNTDLQMLRIVSIAVLLVTAAAAGWTVRSARRRGHGWPGSLARGLVSVMVCFAAMGMGGALAGTTGQLPG